MENVRGRETDSEISPSPRPTLLGPGDGTRLSPPSLEIAVAPANISGQRARPLSPRMTRLDELDSPSSRDFEMNDLDDIEQVSQTNREEGRPSTPRADREGPRINRGGLQADEDERQREEERLDC